MAIAFIVKTRTTIAFDTNGQTSSSDPIPDINGTSEKGWTEHMPEEPYVPDFPIVSEPNDQELENFNPHMATDYRDFKQSLLTFLHAVGKNPEQGEGFADSTIYSTHYKLEIAFRWLWRRDGSYSTDFTPAKASEFLRLMLNHSDKQESSLLHFEKALKRFFKYSNYTRDTSYDWDFEQELSASSGKERVYLKRAYFEPLYAASLEYSSVKSYHNKNMTAHERDSIKRMLSQRFGIPKGEVGPEEFQRATSWKAPALISLTLDVGLRPVEVSRIRTEWISLKDKELQVPKEESTKNEEYFNCVLKDRTAKALRRWLKEREAYDVYNDTDKVWLTRRGTEYKSESCNRLLNTLIDESGEEFPEDVTWYSIRHGVATMWANQVGLHHAKEQLRHKSVQTTLKYLHSDRETRGKAIESLW